MINFWSKPFLLPISVIFIFSISVFLIDISFIDSNSSYEESPRYYRIVDFQYSSVIKIEPIFSEDLMDLASGRKLDEILVIINRKHGVKQVIPEEESYYIIVEKEISSEDLKSLL